MALRLQGFGLIEAELPAIRGKEGWYLQDMHIIKKEERGSLLSPFLISRFSLSSLMPQQELQRREQPPLREPRQQRPQQPLQPLPQP